MSGIPLFNVRQAEAVAFIPDMRWPKYVFLGPAKMSVTATVRSDIERERIQEGLAWVDRDVIWVSDDRPELLNLLTGEMSFNSYSADNPGVSARKEVDLFFEFQVKPFLQPGTSGRVEAVYPFWGASAVLEFSAGGEVKQWP